MPWLKFKSLYIAHLCQRNVSDWLLNKEAYWRILINQWCKGSFGKSDKDFFRYLWYCGKKQNRMWFSVVCTGGLWCVIDSLGCASWLHNILTTVITLSIREQTTLKYITFTQRNSQSECQNVFHFLLTQIMFSFIDVKPPWYNGLACWTS